MKTLMNSILFLFLSLSFVTAQNTDLKLKTKKFKLLDKSSIEGEEGYLTVPENRTNSNSRKIKIKFIRLKSTSSNPKEPVVYLEGGGSSSTWQAENPKDLTDWLPILQVSDIIFLDQRGTTNRKLIHIWKGELPINVLYSEEDAEKHYQNITKEALKSFEQKGIDINGYNIEEHANDVQAIISALSIKKYSIFGFSFGSHIGMALLKLYPEQIVNAVFLGTDGINQSFNYPRYLDEHFKKITDMVKKDSIISQTIPNFNLLLENVMQKLEKEPANVTLKHPLTKEKINVNVGPFGLALILRLDIDDTYDIPVIPRLLYSINKGDYSLLQWFVQKRIRYFIGVPGNGLNQQIASGITAKRLEKIHKQTKESIFGSVMNFPFYQASKVWPKTAMSLNTSEPVQSTVRALFVSGDLDCRTPIEQTDEIIKGFDNATHVIVKNAGHEQVLWNVRVFDEIIPQFLLGNDNIETKVTLKKNPFIPLTGDSDAHPSLQ